MGGIEVELQFHCQFQFQCHRFSSIPIPELELELTLQFQFHPVLTPGLISCPLLGSGPSPKNNASPTSSYPSSQSPPEDGHHEQMFPGVASPPRHSLPLSPTHFQALQHAHQQQYTYLIDFDPTAMDQTQLMLPQQQAAGSHGHQYPTPPSHHSHAGETPQHLPGGAGAAEGVDHYWTPSPDSLAQWLSSSQHSALSDLSEGISSPIQRAATSWVPTHSNIK